MDFHQALAKVWSMPNMQGCAVLHATCQLNSATKMSVLVHQASFKEQRYEPEANFGIDAGLAFFEFLVPIRKHVSGSRQNRIGYTHDAGHDV